jgi:hypothetical protein
MPDTSKRTRTTSSPAREASVATAVSSSEYSVWVLGGDPFVDEALLVEDEAEQPREGGAVAARSVAHESEDVEPRVVLVDDAAALAGRVGAVGGDAVERVGVVEDLRLLDDLLEAGVLEFGLHVLRVLLVLAVDVVREEDGHARRLDVLREVHDLVQARNAERDVLRRHAREVERVERHLRRGLADRLPRYRPDHLAGRDERLREAHADLADDPLERLLREAVAPDELLARELRVQHRAQQQRRVLLRDSPFTTMRPSTSTIAFSGFRSERVAFGLIPNSCCDVSMRRPTFTGRYTERDGLSEKTPWRRSSRNLRRRLISRSSGLRKWGFLMMSSATSGSR